MTVRILTGDCLDVLRTLTADSVDACVTDPPYGIRFMGASWDGKDIEEQARRRALSKQPPLRDGSARRRPRLSLAEAAGTYDLSLRGNQAFQVWCECWAREVLRVLKPGAHLVAFGGTRTYHRLVAGIEDAGFEIRDQLQWLFGEGFPKSRNLDGEWEGWGSALKPAHEPIVLARKPLEGSLAQNVSRYRTGALNIDGCRIPVNDDAYLRNCSGDRGHAGTRSVEQTGATNLRAGGGSTASGRWPANVIHDGSDEVLAEFAKYGDRGAAAPVYTRRADKFRNAYGSFKGCVDEGGATFHGDIGSAARFFYCAKTTRQERDDGLAHLEKRPLLWNAGTQSPGTFQAPGTERTPRNNHPTVKPTALMRWLCRLVTPPGGTVLDPFMGSGSTGRGAFLAGFNFIGIEKDPQWIPIAEARIRAIAPLFAEVEVS